MRAKLREYIFIDHDVLDSFTEQLPQTISKEPTKLSSRMAVSFAGPQFESSREYGGADLKTHEKIENLLKFLRKNDAIDTARPIELDENRPDYVGRPFCLETMVAEKMIIPRKYLKGINNLLEFALWISDPDPSLFTDEPYTWRGTFLYLTQIHLDYGKTRTVYSGCSALQAVVNNIKGAPFYECDFNEPFGRFSSKHPIAKLNKIGAISTGARKITSLYRKRYFTNEQCYSYKGKEVRVNDLLGYPVFIASELL